MEEPRYDFPGTPYDVQKKFMRELYCALSYCRGGIFQSPTGTGKSLSIVCAAFQWLEDQLSEWEERAGTAVQGTEHECDSETESSEIAIPRAPASPPKLIYCSRTHSQVKQFVSEVKKTVFRRLRIVPLASRTKLCINDRARESGDIAKYCEKARKPLETESLSTCPYYSGSDRVTDYVLSEVTDIEDISRYGRNCGGCPYYGVMKAIEHAHVILAPYQYLLTVPILKNLNMVNENTTIVFDEAHNVTETILECNSYEKKTQKFERSVESLLCLNRSLPSNLQPFAFSNDLSKQLKLQEESKTIEADLKLALSTLQRILKFVNSSFLATVDSVSFPSIDFLQGCGIDIVAFQQLVDRMSDYTWSVWRRCVTRSTSNGETTMSKKEVKRIPSVLRFIATFSIDSTDHVIVLKGANGRVATIKKLLVNPITIFHKLLDSSHCIVLTGGTMEPMEEYLRLFSAVPPSLVHICDCEHVIPRENMELFVVGRGLRSEELRLTFDFKNAPDKLAAIGDIIEHLCVDVPNGIVCFFSSFDHIAKFLAVNNENGVLDRINSHKRVFEDRRCLSSTIFANFEEAAKSPAGAILFTVVRGSLSEGINFKHEVGRCAVVVGQPYPNAHEAEMKEKMSFWDREGGSMKGSDYLSNLCFKAVNQCIGRVIRDKEDYAVVVLIDARYQYKTSMDKLSAWAKRTYRGGDVTAVFDGIRRFFASR